MCTFLRHFRYLLLFFGTPGGWRGGRWKGPCQRVKFLPKIIETTTRTAGIRAISSPYADVNFRWPSLGALTSFTSPCNIHPLPVHFPPTFGKRNSWKLMTFQVQQQNNTIYKQIFQVQGFYAKCYWQHVAEDWLFYQWGLMFHWM